MEFQPFILGRGMSGKAIAKALSVVDIIDPEIDIREPVQLERGQSLAGLVDGCPNPLLCVGNPHGLHAQTVLEAEQAGFRDIILDKPVCVNPDQRERLASVSARVAVLHGFRQMWGPRTIKQLHEVIGSTLTIHIAAPIPFDATGGDPRAVRRRVEETIRRNLDEIRRRTR